jgi:hypothetical protein
MRRQATEPAANGPVSGHALDPDGKNSVSGCKYLEMTI